MDTSGGIVWKCLTVFILGYLIIRCIAEVNPLDIEKEKTYPTPYAQSPYLPEILKSFADQKISPDTSHNFRHEYDYIIVGSGTGGSVVAGRLTELSCVSVLLLEAGKAPPLLSDIPAIALSFIGSDIDWKYSTVPQRYSATGLPNRQVQLPCGKTIGGSSVINHMIHDAGNRRNYDTWAAQGATGWSYKDVFPYFKKQEDNRDPEFVRDGFHGTGGPVTVQKPRYNSELKIALLEAANELNYPVVDPNGPTQIGFYDFQAELRNGQRCSAAKAYLVPAENRTNLDVLSEAFVKKIVIINDQATGVQFDFGGNTNEVRAKREVILCAGAFNSAQLLMLSGVGPRVELNKHNIPVIADLPVGQNLQDHCGHVLSYELGDSISPFPKKLQNVDNIETYIGNRTGPLTSVIGTASTAFLHNERVSPPEALPDYQLYLLEAASEVFGLKPGTKSGTFWCLSQLLNPRSRGSVTLNSSDPYDPPLIDPNYYEHSLDVNDVAQGSNVTLYRVTAISITTQYSSCWCLPRTCLGLKMCNTISKSKAMKKIGTKPMARMPSECDKFADNEDLFLSCVTRAVLITTGHPVGTAKMGSIDDPTSVVDPELRVKKIKGLRVVDASIMPIIPSGNINSPVFMIGEKASDMIKRTIKCT